METRQCSKCDETKNKTEFYFKKNGAISSSLCKICHNEKSSLWYEKNKEKHHKLAADWKKKNPERYREFIKKSNVKIRIKNKITVLEHYSNGKLCCACCEENKILFLTLDHLNGNGSESRREHGSGTAYYTYLIKNKFPSGYQVLCFNCNCGRQLNKGKCPHEEK